MYIIIHKYQRWFLNVETKQYLENKPETNSRQTKKPNIFKYGSWVKKKLLTSDQPESL